MQLVLCVFGCLAGQRGPLWWAAIHHARYPELRWLNEHDMTRFFIAASHDAG